MGTAKWSTEHYAKRAATRKKTGEAVFGFTDSVNRGAEPMKVHTLMDPKRKPIIESRDSAEHPESNAVATVFDETGSMSSTPSRFQKSLPQLMGTLLRKGFLKDPQVLIGAYGDATCDRVPLQIGEFETGIEIEDCLTRIYLEGSGGSHNTESSELAAYFLARRTSIDCFEKRGKKGYAFFVGDEINYPKVSRDQVLKICGDTIQDDIPTAQIYAELKEKYDVHYILPHGTHHYNDKVVWNHWAELLGQNCHRLEDPDAICEMIAGIIGICEGVTTARDLVIDLSEVGYNPEHAKSASRSLVTYKPSTSEHGEIVKVPENATESGIVVV